MHIITVIFLSLSLAMDAFAVSVASGFAIKELKIGHALKIAAFFGGFQFGMPIIGWLAGSGFKNVISGIDHWVAFGLLSIIGIKMIYESRKIGEDSGKRDPTDLLMLLVLAVTTSIDALAVGFSLSLINVAIIMPSIVIGVITFALSFIGVIIGDRFGHFFESKVEIAGGVVLIAIGAKILLEHLSA